MKERGAQRRKTSEKTMVFGTKAETLENLSMRLKTAEVLPLLYFTVKEWKADPAAVLRLLESKDWAKGRVIVRSSAKGEDKAGTSLAGAYLSVANVRGERLLKEAIEKVIASYGKHAADHDQVLVQPMLSDILAAGVAFDADPNTGAPYRVLSYDDTSGRTDSVTSGAKAHIKTLYLSRSAPRIQIGLVAKILATLDELAQITGAPALDIEFAEIQGGALIVLQVRPLAIQESLVSETAHKAALARIATGIEKGLVSHPYIRGKRTVYGVMPDWNPAEIVGIRPRPLALSLYRELVTDAIWAYQRDNYGYGNLRSFPLLIDFEGLPYIDVRASFNSFIPKELPEPLAEKLADYYIERLIDNPAFHDKVEFEIIYSCYTLDLRERMKVLSHHGFTQEECSALATALTLLTNRIIHRDEGLWKKDRGKIAELEARQTILKDSNLDDISKLYWLVEDCKRYGTLPFAGLARAGFIAMQILRSFVSTGIFSEHEYQAFLSSLECVSTQMTQDLYALSRDAFLAHYGHLRPGTYDILSARYDETPERYFDWAHIERERKEGQAAQKPSFSLSLLQLKKIESFIARDGVGLDILGLLEFIKVGIEGREYAKFVFTRNVSDFLQLFERVAGQYGFTREDCAYVDVHDILSLNSSTRDIKQWLAQSIARGRERHAMTRSIILPPLLVTPAEVWQFMMPESQPNYITQKQAEGEVVSMESENLAGKIVMLESADPGYDWLFLHPIAGFVTRYGGVNSHMAIRSGELGIPAVIGAGDMLYNEWSCARSIRIDCMNRQVQVQS